MSRNEAEGNRSSGSTRSSGSKQAKSLDPIAKSGSRSQSTTRVRGQDGVRVRGLFGGADREQLQQSHKPSYRQPSPSPTNLLANAEAGKMRSDISLKFDEFNNGVEMYDTVNRSLNEEKNLGPNAFSLTRSYALKLGDISEVANMLKNIGEIQRELRTAFSVKSRVSRSGNLEACSATAERENEEPSV